MAAAASGFILFSHVLIITGTLVGASGLILTRMMCQAMNRSLAQVILGPLGTLKRKKGGETDEAASLYAQVKECSLEDAAMVLENARSVIIVPGFGMAASQAQHSVKELLDALEQKGVSVKFAIHPVAGRMPGHMNVLLAEANVPYEKLHDMEEINPEFSETDAALVVGANDVVNPAAKTREGSPLYGMPILEVENARTVIICKRSLNPGFAGIENELFARENAMMLFGDAKETLKSLARLLGVKS